MLTEVLYEGTPGSRVVHRLYAVQEDEARLHLEPLRVVTNGTATIIESKVCMTGTNGVRERDLHMESTARSSRSTTAPSPRSARGSQGYDIKINPEIDLHSMSGSGKAWKHGDGDCCPSAAIEFTLRLDARELHIEEPKLQRPRVTRRKIRGT